MSLFGLLISPGIDRPQTPGKQADGINIWVSIAQHVPMTGADLSHSGISAQWVEPR